jgi:uncharacterized metal-binding protein
MAIDCADCTSYVCRTGHKEALPENCPMRGDFPGFRELYTQRFWRKMAYHAALVEAEGYGRWPRVREIAEFSQHMGFRRLGIAHCPDTLREARLAERYFKMFGLEAILPPEGDCDPEGQVRCFQEMGTDFNVICGMCAGHDSVFIRASSTPVTSLIVRDTKLQHNPAPALYTSGSYFRKALYRAHLRDKNVNPVRRCTNGELDAVSREIAREGRGNWCRVEEVIELAHRLGATRLGIVFCFGFRAEARVLKRVLNANGFSVSSSCCKTGSVPKKELGITDSQKVRPGSAEMICNPIAQAELLNREKVHLALLLGQCVGHDSATTAHVQAPAVCLVTKDRALGHNPAAALYALET